MPDTTTSKNNVICIRHRRLGFARFTRTEAAQQEPHKKEWSRCVTLALGQQSCCSCYGLGSTAGRHGKASVCRCVLRSIFNIVYRRFQFCGMQDARMGRVSYERKGAHGVKPRSTYSMTNEEFAADFVLVAFRALNDGKTKEQLFAEGEQPSLQWKIFTMHFLLGGDWRACCGKLGMDRGRFYHEVYRIQAQLGLAFAETEPFSLFPLDEYFTPGARSDRAAEKARVARDSKNGVPLFREQGLAA